MNKNLTAFILIVLALGVYFTVTSGVIDRAMAVKSVNDQYVAALTHITQLAAVRDQVLKQYNSISDSDRARLDKMIPSSVDNIRLIIDISSVALRHGFSVTGIKAAAASVTAANSQSSASTPAVPFSSGLLARSAQAGPSIASPTLDTVLVSFGATATYDQFISFLQDLESDLRIMDLTHLSVGATDAGQYNFQVQFQTYWLRQ